MKITLTISEVNFDVIVDLPVIPRIDECVHLIDFIHNKYPDVCKQLEVLYKKNRFEDGWHDLLLHVKAVSYFIDEETKLLTEIVVFLEVRD